MSAREARASAAYLPVASLDPLYPCAPTPPLTHPLTLLPSPRQLSPGSPPCSDLNLPRPASPPHSLHSCSDLNHYMENWNKVLRFSARMVPGKDRYGGTVPLRDPRDADRRCA